MGVLTPITVRSSTIGRLAAFLLVVLIVSPLTAPFSVMSGDLQASPSGPADSIQSETTQSPAVVEDVVFVHAESSPGVLLFRALEPSAILESARVNQVLRL
jgi:hypothetical protein